MENKTVAILLAVYEPNKKWLCELLDSLNAQTYSPLMLYVRDDASPTLSMDELESLLKAHITQFPYVLHRNEQNGGSNVTFERLIKDCKEHYISFCDQDDVWLPNKIEHTVRLLEESPLKPNLVCANVSVIDGEGNEIAPTMEQHRRRHTFLRGDGLAPTLIYRNFVMGCTTVMRRETALAYLPFPAEVVHDHYLAFRAACDGALDYLEEPQMRYRVYGGNQTGVMTGVLTKEDYFKRRILLFDARVQRFSEAVELSALNDALSWSLARQNNYYRKKNSFRTLYQLRKINLVTTLFELIALRLPAPLFRLSIKLIQRGVL